MNIFTSSMQDVHSNQFMGNRPAYSSQYNDNVENSGFAGLVNNEEKSVVTENKKEIFSQKDDMTPSKSETITNDDEVKTGQTQSSYYEGQNTGNDNSDQKVSQDDQNRDDSGTNGKVSEGNNVNDQDAEARQSDLADYDVKSDEAESDKNDNETEKDKAQNAEQMIASLEQILSTEVSIPDQTGEQVAAAGNNTGQASVSTSQNNIIDDSTHINNESEGTVHNLVMDEVISEELNAEDKEHITSEKGNKAHRKNADVGKSDLEELSEDINLDEELKEKIKLGAARDLPEKYVKKTVKDQSDEKTVLSQIKAVDPGVLEELNDFKTLQDKMLFGNTQNTAGNSVLKSAVRGVSDTALNSPESFNSSTTSSNTDVGQNQAMTMANSKAGLGLSQSNVARTAGFSELLNQVVYVAKGRNKLGVTVNHEEFGKLKINVTIEKGMMNIHVNASEKVVREFLESNVQHIVEHLVKDGVNVGGFSVSLKEHKDDPENKFMMNSGLERQYEKNPSPVYSNPGLVNVFA
jgi:flagellar hook-length control protein FliK